MSQMTTDLRASALRDEADSAERKVIDGYRQGSVGVHKRTSTFFFLYFEAHIITCRERGHERGHDRWQPTAHCAAWRYLLRVLLLSTVSRTYLREVYLSAIR